LFAFADEIEKQAPGWKEHFVYGGQPGMHTTETVDYVTVLRGELILELDDGNSVHLYPGDCVIQNGTAHRWINPLPEPAMVATIFVGGKRESK
jgi:quercetin dioxygenase-like cupin family protein